MFYDASALPSTEVYKKLARSGAVLHPYDSWDSEQTAVAWTSWEYRPHVDNLATRDDVVNIVHIDGRRRVPGYHLYPGPKGRAFSRGGDEDTVLLVKTERLNVGPGQ